MKQLFHIKEAMTIDPGDRLALQIGEKHFAFAITGDNLSQLKELAYCISLDKVNCWSGTDLAGFMNTYPALRNKFSKVNICIDTHDTIISAESSLTDLDSYNTILGSAFAGKLNSTPIKHFNLHAQFVVEEKVAEFIHNNFEPNSLHHLYEVQLATIKTYPEEDYLYLDFRNEEFSVIALRHRQLVLAQTFSYSVPADVLYYLLKICQHAGFNQEDVIIHLSGLIERQSGLFKQLYQYFNHILIREASWSQSNEYPSHFFTILNDTILCES